MMNICGHFHSVCHLSIMFNICPNTSSARLPFGGSLSHDYTVNYIASISKKNYYFQSRETERKQTKVKSSQDKTIYLRIIPPLFPPSTIVSSFPLLKFACIEFGHSVCTFTIVLPPSLEDTERRTDGWMLLRSTRR